MTSTAADPTPAEPSTALTPSSVGGWLGEALQIDSINAERLALIKSTVAKDASVAEVGMFLELAAKYDLDPFAKEVWCVKGSSTDGGSGRLLIMVGRDGLRKIAQRNGIHIDGDVVHENDDFTITRLPSGNRTVAHSYGKPKDRGELIGAWAECRLGGPEGRPLGYFYAAIEEYMPTNAKKLQYSPWGSQKAVMILAAAERQALRQATPLSGLLVEGEGEINAERALGAGATAQDLETAVNEHVPEDLQDRAMDLMSQVNALAPGQWGAGKVEMVFKGKTAYAASVELSAIERAIEELEARPLEVEGDIADAEVVEEPEQAPAREDAPADTSDSATTDEEPNEEAALELTAEQQAKAARLSLLVEQRDEDDTLTEQQRSDIDAEIESLEGELPPDIGPGQGSLPL